MAATHAADALPAAGKSNTRTSTKGKHMQENPEMPEPAVNLRSTEDSDDTAVTMRPADGTRDRPAALPQLPPGGRLLPADEAIELLIVGDHPDSGGGSVALDAALIDGLRARRVIGCLLPDGRIAFTVPTGPTGPTPPA